MHTLGLRHVALTVADPQRSKNFYIQVLRMQVEWEPDSDNVYLTSGGQDNLALHRGERPEGKQALDHIGFAVPTSADVDEWYAWARAQQAKVLREIRTHRDGARSFYIEDPDGVAIQIIFHPPIASAASSGAHSAAAASPH